MRIRFIVLIAMFIPLFFLFGLESYLGKYDQHSKYLSQIKESLLISNKVENRNSERISSIISSIDEGNFSKAGECLSYGEADDKYCTMNDNYNFFTDRSDIEILKGGYINTNEEFIKNFREDIMIRKEKFEELFFDFEYNYLTYNDFKAWSEFNQNISAKRYGYYLPAQTESASPKRMFTNGGGPIISWSGAAAIEGGRFRILAISDSFGAGHGLISKDDVWAKELENQLNEIEDKYEVVVLAQNGAGYKEFLQWVEDGYVDFIDPDLVILSYFQNDFNLLYDFENNAEGKGGLELSGLDKELGFYLKCFEEEDDFFGRSLKKANKLFPSLYRFYKFSSCGAEISKVDSKNLINKVDVVESYKRIDNIINVPIFLYNITKEMGIDEQRFEILGEIMKNGLNFINNPEELRRFDNGKCFIGFSKQLLNCEEFIANKFNAHFNRYYSKGQIKNEIVAIKKSIDSILIDSDVGRENSLRTNISESIIVDYLPNTLFVDNIDKKSSMIGSFRGMSYGYERNSDNFCVPFDRKGVIINFNRYLTEGREIKISSEFQGAGLGLVSRGYDEQGKVVYGNAIELKPGSQVSFLGSESVRGLVVLSNNKNCDSNDIITEEFLLQVEIL
jgi:hypothetical protein